MATGPYTIRNMEWDDLPRLVGLSRQDRNPWPYQQLARTMDSPYALGVVALAERIPVAYLIYVVSDQTTKTARKQNKLRLAVGLLQLSTAAGWRRKGAARYLIDTVESSLLRQFVKQSPQGRIRLKATVPESWLESQLFFRSLGFTVAAGGIEKAAFDYCPDDGYLFTRSKEWPLKPASTEPSQPVGPAQSADGETP